MSLGKFCKRFYCLCYFLTNSHQKFLNIIRHPTFFSNAHFGMKFPPFQSNWVMIKNSSIDLLNCRYKSKKESNYDSDEDSDESDDEEVLGKGVELKTYSFESLRVDGILKKAFGYKRGFIEESFYGKKIRINGKILLKKGTNVKAGDEIDLIRNSSAINSNFLNAARLEILKVTLDPEKNIYYVKLIKTKSTMVESYDNDKGLDFKD